MSAAFEAAAERIRVEGKAGNPAATGLSNEKQLELYGLFKQGSLGDNTTANPGMFCMPATSAKWNAYESRKGMSKEEAQQAYIELVEGILS